MGSENDARACKLLFYYLVERNLISPSFSSSPLSYDVSIREVEEKVYPCESYCVVSENHHECEEFDLKNWILLHTLIQPDMNENAITDSRTQQRKGRAEEWRRQRRHIFTLACEIESSRAGAV